MSAAGRPQKPSHSAASTGHELNAVPPEQRAQRAEDEQHPHREGRAEPDLAEPAIAGDRLRGSGEQEVQQRRATSRGGS